MFACILCKDVCKNLHIHIVTKMMIYNEHMVTLLKDKILKEMFKGSPRNQFTQQEDRVQVFVKDVGIWTHRTQNFKDPKKIVNKRVE